MAIENIANSDLSLLGEYLGGNKGTVATGIITVAAQGTADQGETVTVPAGCKVTLKARRTNTGYCYPGGSKVNAEEREFEMTPQAIVSLQVANVNDIWIDATVNASVVEWIVEAA